jgi:NAD(P)-dependent dehydrogenase (short-subunit alcohol dehydrogenase family)
MLVHWLLRQKSIKAVIDQFGQLDVVIANAGVGIYCLLIN